MKGARKYESKGEGSGESTRLPPMWPRFKSRRRRHMWVEFVVGSLPCSERFFPGYSGFPLSLKTNIFKFHFDQESGRRRTTMWMCYLQIVIYFIFNMSAWSGKRGQRCRSLEQASPVWTKYPVKFFSRSKIRPMRCTDTVLGNEKFIL